MLSECRESHGSRKDEESMAARAGADTRKKTSTQRQKEEEKREKAEKLMQLAGFSFSPSDPSDLVVMFCIEKEIWDITSVNYLMDSFDLKDLDGYIPE